MQDRSIQQHISELVAEEHRLRSAMQAGRIDSAEEQSRLSELEAELDQCWDLLRHRRAAREFHEDPDQVSARPIAQVEGYEQ
jgi:hypothetical protein